MYVQSSSHCTWLANHGDTRHERKREKITYQIKQQEKEPKRVLAASPPIHPPTPVCPLHEPVADVLRLEHVLRYTPLGKTATRRKEQQTIISIAAYFIPRVYVPVVKMYVELHVHLEYVLR